MPVAVILECSTVKSKDHAPSAMSFKLLAVGESPFSWERADSFTGLAMPSAVFSSRARDSGGLFFNFPEFVGNATAITISNVYYPAADRDVSADSNNWGVQMGIDAFGNTLREFWPDFHRFFAKKKSSLHRRRDWWLSAVLCRLRVMRTYRVRFELAAALANTVKKWF
jgi:hypothetical protein